MDQNRAEIIAVEALSFLAADEGRLRRLLDWTGLTVEELRARAADPTILGGVLDYLLAHEALIMAFAEEANIDPQEPGRARALLPGASLAV